MAKAYPRSNQLYWVKDNVIAADFPDISKALREPDGLLAIGGDLAPERLLDAYTRGIFPWNNDIQPVLWWSPDPRWVLFPGNLRISRSLKKTINKQIYKVTFNKNFPAVIEMCAGPRNNSDGTWITHDIIEGFTRLHELGYAHSVECWHEGILAGGLYGMAIDRIFFGESMFSKMRDASKVALAHLVAVLEDLDFKLIDCQVYSQHLESLGATPMAREEFAAILAGYCKPGIKLHLPE
jgi:leucyl/phenylalanyl-tRNA--protein transferase